MYNGKKTFHSLKIALFSLSVAFSHNALAADSVYLENVTLPECDANNPEVQFISSSSDWSKINDSSKSVFCVKPGDYSGLGPVTLTADGTSSKRRYIILDNGNDTHPAKLSTSNQANVILYFDNADYWVVDRMSTRGYGSSLGDSSMKFKNGASDNIINRHFLDDFYDGINLQHGSYNITIQNSRIQDMTHTGRKQDRTGVRLSNAGYNGTKIINTKIINNEFKNCSDAIQSTRSTGPGGWPDLVNDVDYSGTIMDSNIIYITPDIYTDGDGHYTTSGKYAYAENAIDLKVGAEDASNPMIITNNIMWGYRQSDKTGSSIGGAGKAMTIHYKVPNTFIENNVIFDSQYGIGVADRKEFSAVMNGGSIKNNIFYRIGYSTPSDAFGMYLYDSKNMNVESNIFVDLPAAKSLVFKNTSNSTSKCNVFINVGAGSGSVDIMESNTYYDNASEAKHTNLTLAYDKYSNNPKTITLYGVIPTESSPHECTLGFPIVSETPVAEETPAPVAEEIPTAEETPTAEEKAGPFIMDVYTKELK